ncbi:MAG TPA: AmmeMemoRadiSam system radical SAM enzyme, partial [Bacillota bacterium]|nr:AmmeMemoRadiSam system radical SAM enzyme [Bacillota bacterium]
RGGKLYTLNYAQITSTALDPIEKKPLYHFYPGSTILSIGTTGCNFACAFCQNWQIAQEEAPGTEVKPEEIIKAAVRYREDGNIGIAYTYSEPAVWFEYMMDVAPGIRQAGLKNVMVTNGFLADEAWERLMPFLDAVNMDVKGFQSAFYKRHCRGELEPVLRSAEKLAGKVHLELTTLLIPGENDDERDLHALTDWVASLSKEIPLHFSRYFPQYKMDLPPTPERTLERAYAIAKEKLDYVYVGNSMVTQHTDTYCPECGELWIERRRFNAEVVGLKGQHCIRCGNESPIIL